MCEWVKKTEWNRWKKMEPLFVKNGALFFVVVIILFIYFVLFIVFPILYYVCTYMCCSFFSVFTYVVSSLFHFVWSVFGIDYIYFISFLIYCWCSFLNTPLHFIYTFIKKNRLLQLSETQNLTLYDNVGWIIRHFYF